MTKKRTSGLGERPAGRGRAARAPGSRGTARDRRVSAATGEPPTHSSFSAVSPPGTGRAPRLGLGEHFARHLSAKEMAGLRAALGKVRGNGSRRRSPSSVAEKVPGSSRTPAPSPDVGRGSIRAGSPLDIRARSDAAEEGTRLVLRERPRAISPGSDRPDKGRGPQGRGQGHNRDRHRSWQVEIQWGAPLAAARDPIGVVAGLTRSLARAGVAMAGWEPARRWRQQPGQAAGPLPAGHRAARSPPERRR